MSKTPESKHGGQILVDTLVQLGLGRAYCVAGESYLPVLDGLVDYPDFEVVTCRQESGATFAAEADGHLKGTPGLAMVTRGPGACNGSIGVHTAHQSGSPMILLVGLISTADRDKEAFQEFDLPQMFGSISKWATVIDSAERIPEYIVRAYHTAMSGRPGPVVLGLPEEILFGEKTAAPARVIKTRDIAPSEADVNDIVERLAKAQRPLIISGGSLWSDKACADLTSFAETAEIPVACAFRRLDTFNHRHPNYIGTLGFGANPDLVARVRDADVILAVNDRLDEVTSQIYTLFGDKKSAEQTVIQTYPDPAEFGKSLQPDLAVTCHVAPLMAALSAHAESLSGVRDGAWLAEGRAMLEAWQTINVDAQPAWDGADMTLIFDYLRDALPENAVLTTDAGNFAGWCQRYLRFGRPGRFLAPVSGAMGYAVPSAVAGAIAHPDRVVVGVCGDGGFMMTGMEIATAMSRGAKPIIIVCNNGIYGTIKMHQEREYKGRPSATTLTNPDFAKLAQSYGAFGAVVEHADEFAGVWEQAVAADTLALIEIRMDARQITTRAKV